MAYLLGALAQPGLGAVSDRIGRRRVSLVAMVVAAGLFLAVQFPLPVAVSVAAIVGGAGLLTAIRSVLLAAMLDRSAHREATTLGFAFSVMDGVGALGAWFAGLAGLANLHYAFGFAAVATATAALLTLRHGFAEHVASESSIARSRS